MEKKEDKVERRVRKELVWKGRGRRQWWNVSVGVFGWERAQNGRVGWEDSGVGGRDGRDINLMKGSG